MDNNSLKIRDIIPREYSDFLDYCSVSGKLFVNEVTPVDFVAFRTQAGCTRDYIAEIRGLLDAGVVLLTEIAEDENAIENDVDERTIDAGPLDDPNEDKDHNRIEDFVEIESENRNSSRNDEDTDSVTDSYETSSSSSDDTVVSREQQSEDATQGKKIDLDSLDPELSLAELFDISADSYNNIEIVNLSLSVRAINCLKRASCHTVGDLLKRSVNSLKSIRNSGMKTVLEIVQTIDSISEHGLVISPQAQTPHPQEKEKTKISDNLKSAIESFLSDGSYSENELNEEEITLLIKVRDAAEIVGTDFCLAAYLDFPNLFRICSALNDFAEEQIVVRQLFEDIEEKRMHLSPTILSKHIHPFLFAYQISTENDCKDLFELFPKETTIKEAINNINSIRCQDNVENILIAVNRFLSWMDFDVDSLIRGFIQKIQEKTNEREWDIVTQRLEGKTLVEIGDKYSITRERVRQIESKITRRTLKYFGELFLHCYIKDNRYDLVMLSYALLDGNAYLTIEKVRSVFRSHSALLWLCFSQLNNSTYFYSKSYNAIIVKEKSDLFGDDLELNKLINPCLVSFPSVLSQTEIEPTIAEKAQEFSLPRDLLSMVFYKAYHQAGPFYCRDYITVVFMCEYVLKNRFPAGYKTADQYESERFHQYLIEFFGDKGAGITQRAFDAKVGEVGVLCDRGKYIHPDFLQVEQSIIDEINDYIEQSPRQLLPYGEIFEALREMFEGTQITNRYLLQGALKKYGCRFNTGRDFVRKTSSVTFVDELDAFIEERGIVHKSEIFAEFTALGEAGLGQVIARSANVFNIDNGYYMHASLFDIQPEDYENLRNYLTEACRDIPVNIRAVHETVMTRFPEFMCRNDFEDRNKLFAALNYMFRGEFSFSRPYIAKLGESDISNRSVILRHIEDYESIEVDELIAICEENSIKYVGLSYLCQSLAPDFYRINETTLMRREIAGITDEVVAQAVDIVKDLLSANDYIVDSKISDFLWFPQIDVEWNPFLLESIIIQSGKINTIFLAGDPQRQTNTVFVSDKYKNDTFDSMLIKLLKEEVHLGTFTSKVEIRDWLREEGFITGKLPAFLESSKYFYVDDTGVHCADEQE